MTEHKITIYFDGKDTVDFNVEDDGRSFEKAFKKNKWIMCNAENGKVIINTDKVHTVTIEEVK